MSLLRRYEVMLHGGIPCYFDVEEFEEIIDHYLVEENSEKALQAIELADAQHPQASPILLRKADVLAFEGYASEAMKIVEFLEKIDRSNIELQLIKARALLYMGRSQEGMKLFDSVLLSAQDDDRVQVLIAYAESLIVAQEYKKAIVYLEQAQEVLSTHLPTLTNLAYCYEKCNNMEQSLIFYNKCLDEDPYNAYLWYSLGNVSGRMLKYEDAIAAYDYAIMLDPVMEWGYFNKAHTLVLLNKIEEAANIFKEYLEFNPQSLYALCHLGECYERMEYLDEALECYNKAIEIDDTYADAYYGLASVMDERGLYEESCDFLQRSIALDPDNSEYWFGMAKAHVRRGEKEEAREALERTVSIDPYDYEAWFMISDLQVEKDFKAAIDVLHCAFKYNFDIPAVNYRLAAMHHAEQNMAECLKFLESGFQLDITQSSEFFNLCPEGWSHPAIVDLYKQYRPLKKRKNKSK